MTALVHPFALPGVVPLRGIVRGCYASDDGTIWNAPTELLPLSTSANSAELTAALAAMGLTLTRGSVATVQTSASTVVTSGIGVDDPRVGQYGLVLEEARTNLFPSARSVAGIAVGSNDTVSADYAAGPDGVTSADRHQILSAGYSNYFVPGSLAARTFSLWIRHATASGPSCIAIEGSSALNSTADVRTVDTTWRRVSLYRASGQYYLLNDGRTNYPGTTAGARDVVIDIVQVEAGAFPTEAILTTGATATRSGDRLRLTNLASVVRNGVLSFELDFIPKAYSRAGFTFYPLFFAVNATNYLAFDYVNGTVTCSVNGVAVSTAPGGIDWTTGQRFRLFARIGNGATSVWTKIANAAAVNRTNATVMASFPSTGSLDLMNLGGAQQFSAWSLNFAAYAPNRRPTWAV